MINTNLVEDVEYLIVKFRQIGFIGCREVEKVAANQRPGPSSLLTKTQTWQRSRKRRSQSKARVAIFVDKSLPKHRLVRRREELTSRQVLANFAQY